MYKQLIRTSQAVRKFKATAQQTRCNHAFLQGNSCTHCHIKVDF